MNTYPLFTRREITDLDGIWKFRFISEEEAPALKDFSPKGIVYDSIETVPGCFDATQQLAGKRGIGLYRRTFCITKSGRHIFSCGGFLLAARVFIDGVEIGFTDQPYSKEAFEFEADAGEHEIIIACDNRFSATPMWEPFYDFYAYGGIIRHTDIMDIPAGAIQRAAVFPLDLEGNVKVAITFDSAVSDGDIALSISFDGGDAINKTVKVSGGKAALELAVPNPTLWSTDAPNLHTIAGNVKDVVVSNCLPMGAYEYDCCVEYLKKLRRMLYALRKDFQFITLEFDDVDTCQTVIPPLEDCLEMVCKEVGFKMIEENFMETGL